ncbi:MAG: hypothetical protein ACI35R_01300 [Bacillus sp. (in: firmicutes)]
MDEKRKKIILNEIHYWKETRILPEQYCNYLLALYSEGSEQERTPAAVKRKPIFSYLYIVLMIASALIVNYFTENNLSLQIPLYLFFIGVLVAIMIFNISKQRSLLIPLLAIAFLVVLLIVDVWRYFFPNQALVLYGALFLNCVVWMVIGKMLKLQYFLTAAVFGFIAIAYFVCSYFTLL